MRAARAVVVNGLTMLGMVFPARAAVVRTATDRVATTQTAAVRFGRAVARPALTAEERGTTKDPLYLVLYGVSVIGCAVMGAAVHGARERHKGEHAERMREDGMQPMEA